MTIEEEVEIPVQKDLDNTKQIANLCNEKRFEHAPWMGISKGSLDLEFCAKQDQGAIQTRDTGAGWHWQHLPRHPNT